MIAMTTMRRARVDVISLGGTISSAPAAAGGVRPTLTGDDLVAAVPSLATVADVVVVGRDAPPVPGPHLHFDDIVEVARCVVERFQSGCDGVVVTQGTDTLEETAFVLDVVVGHLGSIVVTGAMRDTTLPGADGPANLCAAVAVAAAGVTADIGAVVVLNDEIHAARWVRKSHTTLPSTFTSPAVGPIGRVTEGRPTLLARPVGRYRIPLDGLGPVPPIALLRAGMGDDGRLLDRLDATGYRGAVYEAFGGGHVHPDVATRLKDVATRLPVVLASRTQAGGLLQDTYSFRGSERDLRNSMLIPTDLAGNKARALLGLLVASNASREEMTTLFRGPR